MHQPTREAAFEDEALRDEARRHRFRRARGVRQELVALTVKLPAAPPINSRRRALQPHAVTENDGAKRDDACHRVTEKSRVVVFEVARADDDERGQQKRRGEREQDGSAMRRRYSFRFPSDSQTHIDSMKRTSARLSP